VEAFKATLEEVVEADLLIHVVDISHPKLDEQIVAVDTVLEEIGAKGKPTLMVFNKIDRFEDDIVLNRYREIFPQSVGVSALSRAGFPELLEELGAMLRPIREFVDLDIPHDAAPTIARLHAIAQVIERNYDGPTARFKARIPPHHMSEFTPFVVGKN